MSSPPSHTSPRPASFSEDEAHRLHSVLVRLLRRVRRGDRELGLGPARLSALSVLVFGGPRTLGDLARAEQVKPPTMTGIVRGLEQAGLVARSRDPEDGRVVRVEATPEGERLMEEGRARRIRVLQEILEPLDPEEAQVLEAATRLLEGRAGS